MTGSAEGGAVPSAICSTVISEVLLPIAHFALHSIPCDYSTGMAGSHVV